MKDHKALADQNETPEDVATLYSWANLHGAKYREFSASRAQTREKARQRVQEAIAAERSRSRVEAESRLVAQPQRELEIVPPLDSTVQQAAELVASLNPPQTMQDHAWQQPPTLPERYSPPPIARTEPPSDPYDAVPPAPSRQLPALQTPSLRERGYERTREPRSSWTPPTPPEPRESVGRPAWLTPDRIDIARVDTARADIANQPLPQIPEDTLDGSRNRMTSRWFALNGVFEEAGAAQDAAPAPLSALAPVLAVFSLAGGVGKTSLVATLGRALSARGERVLLVDTAAYGLLPFFFGARDQRPGMLRTFTSPSATGDAPIQMVAIDPETLGPENAVQETLTTEIAQYARGVNRIIVDLATASGAITRRVLQTSPTVLVPVIPDMNSVVSVSSIENFFRRGTNEAGTQTLPYYVLNQFDPSLPLHLDVREVLRERFGDRLLPFALRRASSVSEALAEGLTVMDYAPNSAVAKDFGSLAEWINSLAAPASSGYRGVRWSER
jgi:cellulose synthase operon protein YhjQ